MTPQTLSLTALNRATLARQLLIERSTMSPTKLLEHLVGVQAQEPLSWYTSFWTRLDAFAPEIVSRLLEDRAIVRTALMRSTIHLVTADDALRLRPLLQPAVERPMQARGRSAMLARGLDDIAAEARRLLSAGPLSSLELGRQLAEKFPDDEPANLAMAARTSVPLVQVPPRGLWGRSGGATHSVLEDWVGLPLDDTMTIDDLVLRYLRAFGPATPADAQAWSGLTRLREVFERLRPRLEVFRDASGRELFDLPDAPRPSEDTPVPARFLATYDNVLLGHADRSRFISEELRKRLLGEIQSYSYGSVLVDGRAGALWRIERGNGAATLVVKQLEKLGRSQKADVTQEATRLLAFWVPGGGNVRFTPPS